MENSQHEQIVTKVLEALESIRPFLNKDGGDIKLIEIKGTEVYVKLLGNCSSCPISFSTMKLGVESTIKEKVPEITEVFGIE